MTVTQQLLDVKDVARIMSISTRAVYRLIETRKIPFIKWDRSVRIPAEEVGKFIEQHRHEALDLETIAETMCV